MVHGARAVNVGTKSVLFGVHAFWLHGWVVALAWWKLYGFPWDPRLWVAFFIHDLGYWGSPNMDGPEGERHPEWAALWMSRLCDRGWWDLPDGDYGASAAFVSYVDGRGRRRRRYLGEWGLFVLYHSRFYAKKFGGQPSRLCIADKLAIALLPAWIYLPMARATGEIHEYMEVARHRDGGTYLRSNQREWYAEVRRYCREWVEAHKDGSEDTWTSDDRSDYQ